MSLFDGIQARGDVPAAVSDRAWLRAMLTVEASLARAQAEAGVIPSEHADAIEAACAGDFDLDELGREAAEHGNPVLPLVKRLRVLVPESMAASVHKGATSQDILDSAQMLTAGEALDIILSDVDATTGAAARMAREHRATPMAGRTLMQRAEPVTFGFVAAQWLAGIDDARQWVRRVRETRIVAQFGGAVGVLPAYHMKGFKIPRMSWHSNRVGVAEIAASLGALSGVVAKVAGDIVLLAQTEVDEVSEARPGWSSAMPHKRNPVAAISARASAAQAPGLVSTLLAAMAQEHQRAAGMWHAEWRPLRELLVSTGSAVSWLRACLDGLRVHEETMLANLGGVEADAAISAATLVVDQALERMVPP